MALFAMTRVRACVLGVAVLDPVTLILGALAEGAIKGVGETATAVVKDAYAALKKLVAGRLAGKPTAEVALAEHAQDPETWKAPLGKALAETNATTDPEVIEAAERLMALVDPAGATAGKYTVDLRGAHSVQVGDHNTMTNTFGAPPSIPGG
jgi:RIP homotypic interaction motif